MRKNKKSARVFGIRSGRRLAPYYEETGLARLPKKLDCVGERCPVVKQEGSCFVSEHHLYFARHKFENHVNPVYNKLRIDDHAKKNIAHCRHIEWHKKYTATRMPKADMAARFIEESEILGSLGVYVSNMAESIRPFHSEDPKLNIRINNSGYSHLKWYETHRIGLDDAVEGVGGLEVMPMVVVEEVLEDVTRRADRLTTLFNSIDMRRIPELGFA